MSDIDYLVCQNCDTPCYVFELNDRDAIVSAFCAACGNENVVEFKIPEADEMEPDD